MIFTKEHVLGKPEATDDVITSVNMYATNFEKIDALIPKAVPNISLYLKSGKTYYRSQLIYNEIPTVGGYIGWVNLKTGIHADSWSKETAYKLNDIIRPTPNNGFYYVCVTEGVSAPLQPTFPLTVGDTVDDTYGLWSWIPSKPYAVGDIVKKTSGGSTFYYRCIVAGTSNAVEPSWIDINGTNLVDGSVTWKVCKKAIWKQNGNTSEFRPFGKIE